MFIISFYSRVRETLKIDFETFVILQVVVSHSLYQVNKTGSKSYSEIKEHVEKLSMVKLKKNLKLTFASISEVIQLPRETVRRKVLELCKKNKVRFALLKESSPSCGRNTIYDGKHRGVKIIGLGLTAALLIKNGVQVFSEEQIPALIKALAL